MQTDSGIHILAIDILFVLVFLLFKSLTQAKHYLSVNEFL